MKTVFCNWKLNPPTLKEAQELFDDVKALAMKYRKVQLVLLPPIAFLYPLAKSYKGTRMEFGVQDVSNHRSGSYTGEVSAVQAKEAGASYVLVGHAETRARGVTNDMVHEKIVAALDAKLSVIVAIGDRYLFTNFVYVLSLHILFALANRHNDG